jgi:hypothetical protein
MSDGNLGFIDEFRAGGDRVAGKAIVERGLRTVPVHELTRA